MGAWGSPQRAGRTPGLFGKTMVFPCLLGRQTLLHIVRFRASAKAHSFRVSSSSIRTRCAGLRMEPGDTAPAGMTPSGLVVPHAGFVAHGFLAARLFCRKSGDVKLTSRDSGEKKTDVITTSFIQASLPAVVIILLSHDFCTLLSTIFSCNRKSRQRATPNGAVTDGFVLPSHI